MSVRSLDRWASRGALLLAVLFCAHLPGAEDTQQLDEVVVEATRARLVAMRDELVRLEDRFYERYNELNTVKDFDVHCHQEARIGTRLERRYCRAVYEDKALGAEAQDYYLFQMRLMQDPPIAGGPPPPALMATEARKNDFRRNMVKVTGMHPELLDILRERAEVAELYEAARRQIFGLKAPKPETGQAREPAGKIAP